MKTLESKLAELEGLADIGASNARLEQGLLECLAMLKKAIVQRDHYLDGVYTGPLEAYKYSVLDMANVELLAAAESEGV